MEIIEQILAVVASIAVIGFLISGLDDLFFDTQFLLYLFRKRGQKPLSHQALNAVPEQWIAVFVPAWREGGIVNRMAEYAARVLRYEKYDLFVGVYPNDPETIVCLDRVCALNPRIHKVVVPHPGPTSKADCLNWIYRAMRLNEVPGQREYKILALHDAEDILHPLLLKVYNYFIPRVYDMGQVPVFALERPAWRYWTANTYIDDFSELHTKDLFARENIGGVVPSAGVGTCFTRQSIDRLAAENSGEPFHIGNLTEDYEVGIRLKRAGFRAGVIYCPVERIARKRRRDGSFAPPRTVTDVVAVREAFPSRFWAAVRQRTRWILGISFQTWEQAGWAGSLAVRYTLFRDRRAPLTHLINMAGYLTLAAVLAQYAFSRSAWAQCYYVEPLFPRDSVFWKFVILDTWLLAYRAAQKVISVTAVYNFKQACWAIPRVVVGNLINFIASLRALYLFLASKWFGRSIVWSKTDHVFPAEPELSEYAKTVEDLLVEQGLVTREQIFHALARSRSGSAPFCLWRLGLIDEDQFVQVWSRHAGLPVLVPDPAWLPLSLLARWPESQSVTEEAVPIEQTDQAAVVAFREPPRPEQVQSISQQLGHPVRAVLARPSALGWTRNRGYPPLVLPPSPVADWTRRLRDVARLDDQAFQALLIDHQKSRRNPAEILVDQGRLTVDQARVHWAALLDLPPAQIAQPALDTEAFFELGPAFWWWHRLLPVSGGVILTGAPLHPRLREKISQTLGRTPAFQAELPDRLEMAARHLNIWLDPDQVLLSALVGKNLLKTEDVAAYHAARALVTDPLHQWLVLEKRVRPEQLHQIFLDMGSLPPADPWQPEVVRRLAMTLPPGFSRDHGCYGLEYAHGIRLGLSQWPSLQTWRTLHDRFDGYPLLFQTLSWQDLQNLAAMSGPGALGPARSHSRP